MQKLSRILPILFIFLICACSKQTPIELTKNLDYGPYPQDYQEIVRDYIHTLKNVYRYTIVSTRPRQQYANTMEFGEDIPKHGWLVLVSIIKKVYDYPVIGRERHRTKGGDYYYTNVYGDQKVLMGYQKENYHFYIKNGHVAYTDLLNKSDVSKTDDL